MSILDRNLVSEALGEKSITQVARQRHPQALSGDLHDIVLLADVLVHNEAPKWPGSQQDTLYGIVAAFMGFDTSRSMTDPGFAPPRPPNGFEENPVAFTRNAIHLAIDLHMRNMHDVVARVCANILLKTRGRENWRVKTKSGGDWYYPAESDIARARRMLEIATSIPREEIVV
jgi:hypothetical protein